MLIEWEGPEWTEYWQTQYDFSEEPGPDEGGVNGLYACVVEDNGEARRKLLVDELAYVRAL